MLCVTTVRVKTRDKVHVEVRGTVLGKAAPMCYLFQSNGISCHGIKTVKLIMYSGKIERVRSVHHLYILDSNTLQLLANIYVVAGFT